jgi:hypothetical protein
MSSRYRITERAWFTERTTYAPFIIQVTDCRDTRTGTVYADGAYRVVDARTGKAVRGKGGSAPFYGETAWSDAERLASDLLAAERFAR